MPFFLQTRRLAAALNTRNIYSPFQILLILLTRACMRGVHTKITAGCLTQWCVLTTKNGSYRKQKSQNRSNEVFLDLEVTGCV